MEKSTPIEIKLAAAKLPVGAEQIVIAEDPALDLTQDALAHQAEIGQVLFPFAGIRAMSFRAPAEFQRHGAGMAPIGGALLKAAVASAKDGAEHALARHFFPFPRKTQAVAVAVATRDSGEPDGR